MIHPNIQVRVRTLIQAATSAGSRRRMQLQRKPATGREGTNDDKSKDPSVVFVINSLSVGGAERQLIRLASGLQRQGGWKVSVYCLTRTGGFLHAMEESGVLVAGRSQAWSKRSIPLVAWHLFCYLRRERPAIVHAYLPAANVIGAVVARAVGVRTVVTSRSAVVVPGSWHGLAGQLVLHLTRWISTVTIAVCETARQNVLDEGASPESVVTVPNAVSILERNPERQGAFEGFPVVGSTSRLVSYKGHTYLIDAFRLLIDEFPKARLVLVGDGRERPALEQKVRSLHLEDQIQFLGEVRDARSLLSEFDIFVLPSLEEGMPNGLLEAMAFGVPAVASNIDGVGEVIVHEKSGLLVEPASPESLARALIRLARSETARRSLADAARTAVRERYSPELELAGTVAVYLRCLARDAGENDRASLSDAETATATTVPPVRARN